MAIDPISARAASQALMPQRQAQPATSPLGNANLPGALAPLGTGEPKGPDFGAFLSRALDKVGEAQGTADAKTMALLQGEDIPIHDVMVAVTEAEIAVQTTTVVAAKAIQAYQEIWRMDI